MEQDKRKTYDKAVLAAQLLCYEATEKDPLWRKYISLVRKERK